MLLSDCIACGKLIHRQKQSLFNKKYRVEKRGGSSFSFCRPDRYKRTPLLQQTHIKRQGGGAKVVIKCINIIYSNKVWEKLRWEDLRKRF